MNLLRQLEKLPRQVKRAVYLFTDVLLIPICLYFAFALRYGQVTVSPERLTDSWMLFPLMMVMGVGLGLFFRVPDIKLIHGDLSGVSRIAYFAISLTVVAIVSSFLFRLFSPRSVPIIFGVLLFLAMVSVRLIVQFSLNWFYQRENEIQRIAIYGAGQAGIQLASAFRQSREFQTVVFIDDNRALQGRIISGIPVHAPAVLENMVKSGRVSRVVLALPSATNVQQRKIVRSLESLGVEIQSLPSYSDLVAGKALANHLKPVSLGELLGRDKVVLDLPNVREVYHGRTILVTGAGGSIGAELCRQVLARQPSKILLLDHSEFALYSIQQELSDLAIENGVHIEAILGSVCNTSLLERVFKGEKVDIVFHAAAYKHVPIVENNQLQGIENNVFGTKTLAEAAMAAHVGRFVLISTDKAVRPTNIMGASKRLAELIIQNLATRGSETLFSMVRFGNVLGSSGSVIPLFQKQISRGGPITLTHEDVTRYFMTIPEAARLVILAGTFAEGGDVFVLDMGDSVRIHDLARRMIELSGLTVRDEKNPQGDIEIQITGLRSGEKLFEELLISDNMLPTPHGKILRAKEKQLPTAELNALIQKLAHHVTQGEELEARQILLSRVDYQEPYTDNVISLRRQTGG